MKKLEFMVIHCTATREGQEISADLIRQWHTAKPPKGHGWRKVGYTDMIHLGGELENLTPFDQDDEVDGYEITNGVRGINSISRHVVYVGGLDASGRNAKDTRTEQQIATLTTYVKYMVMRHPGIKIAGHNQFAAKDCPSFDVPTFLRSINIAEENIHC